MIICAVTAEIPTYVGQNLWRHVIESRFDHDELDARCMREKEKSEKSWWASKDLYE